jgi:hypothetical protein
MHAPIIDAPETHRAPGGPSDSANVVTQVGTFASGQSPHGSFPVSAAAEVGSFASGVAAPQAPETA